MCDTEDRRRVSVATGREASSFEIAGSSSEEKKRSNNGKMRCLASAINAEKENPNDGDNARRWYTHAKKRNRQTVKELRREEKLEIPTIVRKRICHFL